jgi:hypothetical protein
MALVSSQLNKSGEMHRLYDLYLRNGQDLVAELGLCEATSGDAIGRGKFLWEPGVGRTVRRSIDGQSTFVVATRGRLSG